MLILSQDKNLIINFDNTENLWINGLIENNNGKFEIRAETHSANIMIGEYDTEERTQQVLRQIFSSASALDRYVMPEK